jgi:hypothetical protein
MDCKLCKEGNKHKSNSKKRLGAQDIELQYPYSHRNTCNKARPLKPIVLGFCEDCSGAEELKLSSFLAATVVEKLISTKKLWELILERKMLKISKDVCSYVSKVSLY